MKISYYGYTDKGAVRDHNEDSILCNGEIFFNLDSGGMESTRSADSEKSAIVLSVADGMGGHSSGEVASKMTLEKLKDGTSFKKKMPSGEISNLIREIHKDVNKYSVGKSLYRMGTTLTGCYISDGTFFVFNVGDSRVYRLNSKELAQVTQDHTASAEAGLAIKSNFITSCIGGGLEDITLDIFDLSGKIRAQEIFLICSDGLIESLTDPEIKNLIDKFKSDLKILCNSLIEASIQRGSADNISCVLFQIDALN
ncbi:MAG: protein phosphatase 2C domain-containing protein [Leptospira sp.]|nr:protein phosphatase 2C domain-containing protein [Leptospira sp.]